MSPENGKRTKKESFLGNWRKRADKELRKVSSGRSSESPGRLRTEQESFAFPAECLVVGFAVYFGQNNWSWPDSMSRWPGGWSSRTPRQMHFMELLVGKGRAQQALAGWGPGVWGCACEIAESRVWFRMRERGWVRCGWRGQELGHQSGTRALEPSSLYFRSIL